MRAIPFMVLLALTSGPLAGEELVTFRVLAPDTAVALAQGVLADCRGRSQRSSLPGFASTAPTSRWWPGNSSSCRP